MTLENCKRLLAHYEKIGYKEAALDMRRHLAAKGYKEATVAAPEKKGK